MDTDKIDSAWACQILDKIGIKEKLRQTHSAIIRETLSSLSFLHHDTPGRTFIFGSAIEGSTTPDMDPDMDTLFVGKDVVIEMIDDAPVGEMGLMVVSDNDTYPGYVKLHIVVDRIAVTKDLVDMNVYERLKMFGTLDRFGKYVRRTPPQTRDSNIPLIKHGPAMTRNSQSKQQTDLVFAFYCQTWNIFAQEWFNRKREYNWPDKGTVTHFKRLGFFLVPVSHPYSNEIGLDWRVSFSLQERQLMFSLTDKQYKCYVFLKLIKSDFIKPVVLDAISSYHMKTCLFYVIERNPSDIWRREKFLDCVQLCLTYLLSCIWEGNCPNYFIPAENMFHGRLVDEKRLQVEKIIQEMLSTWPECLKEIKYDKFGQYLNSRDNEIQLAELEENSKFYLDSREYFVLRGGVVAALEYKLEFLKSVVANRNMDSGTYFRLVVSKIRDQIELLSSLLLTETEEHSYFDALLIVKPYFHTMLGSHLAINSLQCPSTIETDENKNSAFHELIEGEKSDSTSGILKYASVLYFFTLYKDCSDKLESIEHNLPQEVVTVCQCRDIVLMTSVKLMESLSRHDRQNILNFLKAISTCVMFLPTEYLIVPDALKFEFFRCIGTHVNTRSSITDAWYDWVVVDGIVYLYFLQYLTSRRLNKSLEHRLAIIEKLENCIKNPNIGHRETAYNILSWMAVAENLVLKALQYIMKSWEYLSWLVSFYKHPTGNEHNNAAKWHMLVLLYKIWYQKLYTEENCNALNFCFECLEYLDETAQRCKCKVARYCSDRCRSKNMDKHTFICK